MSSQKGRTLFAVLFLPALGLIAVLMSLQPHGLATFFVMVALAGFFYVIMKWLPATKTGKAIDKAIKESDSAYVWVVLMIAGLLFIVWLIPFAPIRFAVQLANSASDDKHAEPAQPTTA